MRPLEVCGSPRSSMLMIEIDDAWKENKMDHQDERPMPGWACIGVGAGFIALVVFGLAGVLLLRH